jgi:hypothetical protein
MRDRSLTVLTCWRSNCAPSATVIEMGTLVTFSDRRWAVTTISPSSGVTTGWALSCAMAGMEIALIATLDSIATCLKRFMISPLSGCFVVVVGAGIRSGLPTPG